jgi:Tfp pilus assembly protein PilO
MKNKYLILFAVIVIVSLLFFHISSTEIDSKIVKIDKYDKRIKQEQERLNSAKVLNEQLKGVSQVILNSMTDKKTIGSKEVNMFVNKLADLADKYHISIQSLLPKSIKLDNKFLAEELYSIEFTCTYIQLGEFLSDLEAFNYMTKVKTLEVQPITVNTSGSKNENLETRYQVVLEISVYKIIKEA